MQAAVHLIVGALAGYLLFGAFAEFGIAAAAINLLTPLPAVYNGFRFGPAHGWLTVALTGLCLLVLHTTGPLITYLLQFGLPAGVLGWLLWKKVAWDRAVLVALGAMVAAGLIGLVLSAAAQGTSAAELAGGMIDREVSQAQSMMQEMFAGADLPADEAEEINQGLQRMADFMREVYAGLAITVSMFMLLGQVLLLALLGRGRYEIPGPSFHRWKAPEPLIWLLIAAGFVVFLAEGGVRAFGSNLLVIILPIYFLQGLAVVDSFFRRKAFSPLLRSVGYLLLVLVNPLPLLVACIGVFDLWIDFRKPRISKSQ